MAIWNIKERYNLVRGNAHITSGDRGLWGGSNPAVNSVDHLNITINSTATDFGDLTEANRKSAAAGGITRTIRWGGETPSAVNTCDFANPFNAGNFADFGDLSATGQTTNTAHSNNVFAVGASGQGSANANLNKMIQSSTGNAFDFGDATRNLTWSSGGGNRTRFLTAGIYPGANSIDIKSMSSDGDSVDFGDLSSSKWGIGTASDITRAVFCGGSDPGHSDDIEFVTISTAGNVTDFGNLTAGSADASVASNSKRAVIQGQQNPSNLNQLDLITIQTTGNATDFGALATTRHQCFGVSNGDGGLPQADNFGQRSFVTYQPGSGRAVFAGGSSPGSEQTTIDMIFIPTAGDASDFGDLPVSEEKQSSTSNVTRSIFQGGNPATATMSYINFSVGGGCADFGDATAQKHANGLSSATRGVWAGGVNPGVSNVMEYITMASVGNSTDFGDLTDARNAIASTASPTRGVMAGGISPGYVNIIDYITIASAGNASDFGDMTDSIKAAVGTGSDTRGIFAGGYTSGAPGGINVIQYITIASTGDGQDFGDLTAAEYGHGASSNNTKGIVCGSNGNKNIDVFTIASTGDATDFGDLSANRYYPARGSCSDSHGGLQ